jgi:hypothetical protein
VATDIFPHQLRFVVFQRTGVRLLLRDAHRDQSVKNFLALDFQLTGQIVDSNLTHPLSLPLLVPTLFGSLRSHIEPLRVLRYFSPG